MIQGMKTKAFGFLWHAYPDAENRGSHYFHATIGGVTWKLHRYTWVHHHGPIPKGYDVHHINGDKTDNRLANLEVLARKEHGRKHRKYDDGSVVEAFMRLRRSLQGGTCEHCQRTYTRNKISQRFCSPSCVTAARRASGVDDEPRECVECSAEFQANRHSKKQTCSSGCGAKLSGRKRRTVNTLETHPHGSA